MPAVTEHSGWAVRGWLWSMAQESTSPMVRPAASSHQLRWAGSTPSFKAKTST